MNSTVHFQVIRINEAKIFRSWTTEQNFTFVNNKWPVPSHAFYGLCKFFEHTAIYSRFLYINLLKNFSIPLFSQLYHRFKCIFSISEIWSSSLRPKETLLEVSPSIDLSSFLSTGVYASSAVCFVAHMWEGWNNGTHNLINLIILQFK